VPAAVQKVVGDLSETLNNTAMKWKAKLRAAATAGAAELCTMDLPSSVVSELPIPKIEDGLWARIETAQSLGGLRELEHVRDANAALSLRTHEVLFEATVLLDDEEASYKKARERGSELGFTLEMPPSEDFNKDLRAEIAALRKVSGILCCVLSPWINFCVLALTFPTESIRAGSRRLKWP
jgi:hypothetical protein